MRIARYGKTRYWAVTMARPHLRPCLQTRPWRFSGACRTANVRPLTPAPGARGFFFAPGRL